jgi:RNA polymerase sigma-70 factor, ECF subfamily
MDRELVKRAMAGDHGAFTAVAAASLSRLHRTARLILRDDDRASDAVQEALVAAWLDIRGMRDPDRFDAWVHRLLVRACYREARRGRRRQVIEIQVTPTDEPVGRDDTGGVADRDQLERAFRRLSPEHRAVLVVHHYLRLSDAEAADMLGIRQGTFKSRLNRATAGLRAVVDADDRRADARQESLA